MAPIVASIEIARRPEEVFSYVTDPSRLTEWQESIVTVRRKDAGPVTVGSRAVVTRRVGRREQAMTAELSELNPPRSWAVRGIDGPARGNVKGTIEPFDDGARSRVTIELDFEGHGIGKLGVASLSDRVSRERIHDYFLQAAARSRRPITGWNT